MKDSAERYEGGGLPFGLLHALGTVAEWLVELGPREIEARVLTLAASARTRLQNLGADAPDTWISNRSRKIPRSRPVKLARELKDRRVLVAARHGFLRVSPHFYNNEEDLDRLETELRKIL